MTRSAVFVTGATGFMGRALVPLLAARAHPVHALVRPGSERKLPQGCEPVIGDVLRAETFAPAIPPDATLVQLVGVAHPAPWKEQAFRAVDRAAALAALEAARRARVRHFVYLSVAQPAPLMRAYVTVREECERAIRSSSLPATFLRPWYVLGPGRSWPLALQPLYWLAERLSATRSGARRLGLITLAQMTAALTWAIEHPPEGVRVLEVPDLRRVAGELDPPPAAG